MAASSAKALPSATFFGCLHRAVQSMSISVARSRPVRANKRATELPGHGPWQGGSGKRGKGAVKGYSAR
eukprot:1221744-Prymnesium_polylepis.1